LTGYGQDGPYGKVAGHDLNYLALSGVLGLLGTADEVQIPLNLVADLAGGAMFATIAILAALHSRSHGGSGQYLDLSYVDGTLALLGATTVMRQHLTEGFEPGPGIGLHSGLYPYYTTYSCKDGKRIAVGCAETSTWQALCAALDEPELIPVGPSAKDHWRAPESVHHRARARLAEIFATRDRDEWIAQLSPLGTCVSKVSEVAELFSDPQLRHRSMVHDGMLDAGSIPEHNIMSPLRMTGRGYLANVSAPYRGQQSDEILGGLGYTESEVRDLRSRNVV
jgi:alpha-methylacyl-CoA racemase